MESMLFQNFVDEKLSFFCRVYSWKVPENNKLLLSFKNSFLNTTLSNFIDYLEKYVLCPGISKGDSCSIDHSFRQHPVQKIFLPFSLHDVPSSSCILTITPNNIFLFRVLFYTSGSVYNQF